MEVSRFLQPINDLKETEFLLAGKNGKLDLLQQFWKQAGGEIFRKTAENHSNKLGKTVLHEAAQNGHLEIVNFLVSDLKVHPDCLKQGDWTPLMLACAKENVEIVRSLVIAGSDLHLRNKDGWTPFHIAARSF